MKKLFKCFCETDVKIILYTIPIISVMRCFIAIDVDKEIVSKIVELQKDIRNLDVDVKLVEPENIHFTVKFLGDVNENEVNGIKLSLEDYLSDVKSFPLTIKGIGYFGSSSYVRTLWLGLSKGEGELIELMKIVNNCVKIGDGRFSPHITIGRVKSCRNKETIMKFVNETKDVNMGEMEVTEVKLKSSELGRNGPKYSDLAVFKLRL